MRVLANHPRIMKRWQSVRFLPENGIFLNAERRDCNKLEMDMDKCTDNEKFCQHKSNSLGRT